MPGWGIALIVVGIVLVIVVAMVAYVINMYNAIIRLKNATEEAYSTMDVYMKKRYYIIPNFVETVKGFAKHEEKTLEGVMQARYSCLSANDPEDKAKKENMLTGTLKTLFNVTESYPALQANQNFIDLQNTLKSLENEIASARKYYNGCVKNFNNKIEIFPSNLIAKWFKFEKKVSFEITNEDEKVAPKVQF